MKKLHGNKFIPNTPIHVYQHSVDFGVIFYDEILILELFMIMSVCARRYNITVYASTFMITHIHNLISAHCKHNFDSFWRDSISWFSKEYNRTFCRIGSVFSPIDYSPKTKDKDVRSTINYIANNGPEKKLSRSVMDYKWNFYWLARKEFDTVTIERYSKLFQIAYGRIFRSKKNGCIIDIESLILFRSRLPKVEWSLLVEIIIKEFNYIQFDKAVSYYGNLDNYFSAPDNNTGGEYQINEHYDGNTYLPYKQMCKLVYLRSKVWSPFNFSNDELEEYACKLVNEGFSPLFINGFLHTKLFK